jgi:hypothetical protein
VASEEIEQIYAPDVSRNNIYIYIVIFQNFLQIASVNPLRTESILRKLQKVMKLTQKWKDVEKLGPHGSLSEDLSNNYQCYRVSIASKIFIIFLFSDFGDRSRLRVRG